MRGISMKNIFITGGAGYLGTVITSLLLSKGHKVTIYDNLMYDSKILIPFFSNKNFKFIKGDILDKSLLEESIKGHDTVIHLAAIVGYFACQNNERLTKDVNVTGTQNVIDVIKDDQYLLFGSTGSNYGIVEGICTEETTLHPGTLYGITKTESEKRVMARGNSTAFRFATAFGTSPRLRMDLLINDLVFKAMEDGCLVIYQSSAMRTFIHLKDIARCFLFAINNHELMKNEVYNCGSNELNFSKKQVCEIIKAKTNCYVHYNDYDFDKDNRDYEVSYDKLSSLGFKVEISLEQGIDELITVYNALSFGDKRYKNTAYPEVF
jgi:nucleoside-diphosphate-sugar epimerase